MDLVDEIRIIAKSIFFETNSDKIADTCFVKLDRLVQILNSPALPTNTILDVEGHTDKTGNADYNVKLSKKRANAVKVYLVSKGISTDRLKAIGFGLKIRLLITQLLKVVLKIVE